ncbi:ATP-binding cassette domain-containing protein [Arthrobacter sp. W4I7]|uniref:ATP-binding cassette domain-containing protein n=1 Tax=Arthrobacter sp. W4I7 TaxID=3042296 RepID=UPI002789CA8A|nr:ATP-binding cassette domain-containing protein [Arthrobacter sp. W4I7]MDQ0691452.1 ABC-type glutathione transport system ATPase component [Arthrobacter sp. W4I7]
MTLLQVRDLTKSFVTSRTWYGSPKTRFHAVKGVSFDVEAGQTVAVVGESGAGKSTLGRMVLRLIEPDAGSVRMDDTDVLALSPTQLRAHRRNAQIVFQDPFSALDPRCSILQAVSEPLKVHFGLGRDEQRIRATELLARVGLGAQLLDRYPGELSGGQLQRVVIARALALEPRLVVCDEPVAALDVSVRAQVLSLMEELQSDLGLAYLFITHDLSLVESIADQVVVMAAGEVVESGSVEEIFDSPREEYTRVLLDAIPVPMPPARGR